MEIAFGIVVAVIVLAVIASVLRKKPSGAAVLPRVDVAPPPPPTVIVDPVIVVKPPVPPVVVPPVVVVPPPPVEPPPPAPPAAKLDYSPYRGETRRSIEMAVRDGWALPAGWNWADAFASGHVKDVDTVNMGGPAAGPDRSMLYWPAPGASAIWNIAGHPGQTLMSSFPVPRDFKGTIKIGAYGQRGSDPAYGGRIDDMKFTVSDSAGNVLDSNHGSDVIFESIPVPVNPDNGKNNLGTCTAVVVIGPVGGVGYVQLNVYPK